MASWDKYIEGIIQTKKHSTIYLMPHYTIIRVIRSELQNSTMNYWLASYYYLLLLLILPIYLGMCPSVPTHIHPYMSKLRLLLKPTRILTNNVYSGCHACPGPRSRVFRCRCTESTAGCTVGGSYLYAHQESNRKESTGKPLGTPGGPQVEPEVWVVQYT